MCRDMPQRPKHEFNTFLDLQGMRVQSIFFHQTCMGLEHM